MTPEIVFDLVVATLIMCALGVLSEMLTVGGML